ncbi:similar to Saccharomyces cerevisiae YGL156W AMS1 Vacuolar alpha mannosidase, involved in free oligosaccharide (fOS) degradation [Maudiozyma saulgeensis]|uniref:Alpha-mannosidase n=1 Tax=Maudiozyma saulgeensis TaxID=1789683 RepID=A0A1X7R155_9SACH|nr:similar to Saccharomyces cerevisiae YGL156W AMS1 Vacuolar alpha mannosidase, involved in free oligosaccharide (fOS) degradation [Kazachstania saulgeensis]
MADGRINYDPQFKPVQNIYEDRLRQFIDTGGDYHELNLTKFYDKKRISLDQNHVKVKWYQVPFEKGSSPVSPDKRPSWESIIKSDKKGELNFKDAYKGQPFGPSWSTTWFKVHLSVPQDWVDTNEQLIFNFNCNNEGLVIDPETLLPQTAFSGGERAEYLLPKQENGEYFFYIETGNNGMFGCGSGSTINPPDDNRYFHLDSADIILPDWEARALRIDFWMLSDAARELPGETWQKHRARQLGNDVMTMFDPQDRKSIEKCRAYLKKEYFDKYTDDRAVYFQGDDKQLTNVYGVGNCHIDTAWLWPFAETKRKIVRSWASQCTIMNEYPEYQFVASQAQQFKWLLENHPKFFNDVLIPKVQDGQFIPIGGSWVENDTNIPNGESLARQFFFGQRFFLKYFGVKSDIFWLPDTFGYSSQVPQLCQLSGLNKFLTQKLSWNNINSFPHSTFNWAGIDGSVLLTHMPPGNTYTADSHFGDVLRSARQNKSNEFYGSGLMLYGKGDGGGGPTREMMEKMRRIRSMSNKNGNVIPKLQVGTSVDEFYQDILDRTNDGEALPTWNGELYFEFHRGTYTTQAKTKYLMRKSEIIMHDLEWIATKTSILYPDEYNYPIKQINDLWENILLCQFHDVLPGSCIEMVYKYEAVPMLEGVITKCSDLIKKAVEFLMDKTQKKNDVTSISTLDWVSSSIEQDDLDQFSSRVKETEHNICLCNGKLEVVISKKSGAITSIKDLPTSSQFLDIKNGRNKLGANQFVLFDDKPLNWQAWDTELYSVSQYKYLQDIEKVAIIRNSKSEVAVEVIVKVSPGCSIKSTISLKATTFKTQNNSKIDISTLVRNWDARNKFLKVEFPVNVRSEFASYETQFGVTRRPTVYNTSWDVAKFEVCHHKFADYSEFSKGVSIINDCKYGFSTHGNLMRLSLLRSSKAPDAHADMGTHQINYAIYPHRGQLGTDTVKLSYEFNYNNRYSIPSEVVDSFKNVVSMLGDENVILSNIKRGEEDASLKSNYSLNPKKEKSVIVRLYESLGGESRASLVTSYPLKCVCKIDNLELKTYEKCDFVTAEDKDNVTEIPIVLRPFEVASYKLVFA